MQGGADPLAKANLPSLLFYVYGLSFDSLLSEQKVKDQNLLIEDV